MTISVLTTGVVLAAEKKVTSKLLESKGSSEKMYKLDENLACAVAGLTADVIFPSSHSFICADALQANIVINYARLTAQRYLVQFVCFLSFCFFFSS